MPTESRWVTWCDGWRRVEAAIADILTDVLGTVFSPELVPSASGAPQAAEETVGPYELQNFNLYFISRFGYRPSKVAFLAHHAWSRRDGGGWPVDVPESERHEYDLAQIKHWLEVFIVRFFATSQFKRAQSGLRRIALPARRLARTERRAGAARAG